MNKQELWMEVNRDIHLDKFFDKDTTYCLYNGCKISYTNGNVELFNCNTWWQHLCFSLSETDATFLRAWL